MDSRRERLLASLLGGVGTVVGVIAYQGIPDLLRFDHLAIRLPNAIWFTVTVFLIGAAGGRIGHALFIETDGVAIEVRALAVGAAIGFAIALTGWTATKLVPGVLVPLAPLAQADANLSRWLPTALVAGPAGGIVASLAVVRHLRALVRLPRRRNSQLL